MALLKSQNDIQAMREGGALLSRALQAAVDAVKPGITMTELDQIATKVLEDAGGKPSFKGYSSGGEAPFPSTVCISNNHEVVHGLGNRDVALQEGDIVGMDIGVWHKGLCTDMACTVPVGNITKERLALLRVTRDAMFAGVDAARPGHMLSEIGGAVEDAIDQKKYGIVKALVGHGVGHEVHESPHVPNYRSKQFPDMELQSNMCIAIEPMITTGTDDVVTSDDGWTIETADMSDSAHFEVTLAILEDGPEILTPQPVIKGL
jgi:methionyl aminopeptidase